MIGDTISHYRVIRQIGGGGMGEVYEAEDTRLHRRVALKFLPAKYASDPDILNRFELEGRAASQLNHANICTVYDLRDDNGRPYLVMELLEGESLKDKLREAPLPLAQVLDVGIQMADALDAAHSSGIIHRDIKPANIHLTARGVKLLDFGVAKLTAAGLAGGPEALTDPNTIPGTTFYMAPEQVRGESVDPRADVFSLGVVLYEMATGYRPFEGKNSVRTLSSILDDKPVSPLLRNPDLPFEFEAVIGKALEKDREKRYQSASALREDLEALKRETDPAQAQPLDITRRARRVFTRVSARHRYLQLGILALIVMVALVLTAWWVRQGTGRQAGAPANTAAVLPFRNESGDASIDYLRFALADEVSTILTYMPTLEMRPVGTRFVEGLQDPLKVGRDMRVAWIIGGHYVRRGDNLMISLEAVDVKANRVAWKGQITAPSANLINVQEVLAGEVRRGLLPVLGGAAVALQTATKPRNAEAYDLFLRSTAIPRDPDPNRQAIAMLERSVELDRGYAPAWDALGLRHYYDAQYGGGGPESFDRAVEAYETAAKLDSNFVSAIAHITRIHVERGELELAYKHAQNLLQRRPDNALAHFTMSYVLRYAGLHERAAVACNKALALDPGNYVFRSCAFTFFEIGNATRAMDFLELDAGSEWATNVRPAILLRGGLMREARDASLQVSNGAPWNGELLQACLLGRNDLLVTMVHEREAELLNLRDPEFRYYQASLMSFCGARDIALMLLRSAIDSNYCATSAMERDPLLDNLRTLPEFDRLRVKSRVCQRPIVTHNTGTASK